MWILAWSWHRLAGIGGSGVSTDRIWEMGGGLEFTQATNVHLNPGVSTVSSIQNIPYNWSLHSYKNRVTCWS